MRKVYTTFIYLLIGIGAGCLLLFIVHLLPTGKMKEHVQQSMPMITSEFDNSEVIMGYSATLTGNFTDCLMLENAVYTSPEHNTWEQMMMMYRGEITTEGDGWAPGYSLQQYLETGTSSKEIEYSRYWHGYLVILKPLLLLANVATIRLINALLQNIVLLYFMWICHKRNQMPLGIAVGVMCLFLYSFTMYSSLSLSICFYLMMAAAIVQVRHNSFISRYYWDFFLITGIVTAYFDFLTYPLITLGVPLCIMITMNGRKWSKDCVQIAVNSIGWGIGYLGMWASKWIITDLTLHTGTIRDALLTIQNRTGKVLDQEAVSWIQVAVKNMSEFVNRPYLLLLSGIGLIMIIRIGKSYFKTKKKLQFLSIVPYVLIAVFPFIWFLGTQNHSYEHWMFTCKILAISVLAVMCAGIKLEFSAADSQKDIYDRNR